MTQSEFLADVIARIESLGLTYFSVGESDKHLTDIAHMCQMAPERLNVEYIERWAKDLGLLPHWQAVQQRLQMPPPRPPSIP